MKVADLLNNLATTSGIDITNPALAKLVVDTANIELPEEISSKINSSFMTIEAAKSNPILKSHFQAQAYSGIDNTLKESLIEAGLTEDQLKEVLIDKKTGQSVKNALSKIAELNKKATDPNATKVEKDAAINQINDLNLKLSKQAIDFQNSLSEKDRTFGETLANVLLENQLSSYKYALPTSQEANILTAKTLLNQEMQGKGIKLITENNKLKLVTTDNTDYFENNKKIEVKDIIDTVVAKHKLIEVSNPNPTPKVITTNQITGGSNKFAERASQLAETQQ